MVCPECNGAKNLNYDGDPRDDEGSPCRTCNGNGVISMSDEKILEQIADKLVGIYREDLSTAEHKIFQILHQAGFLTLDPHGEVTRFHVEYGLPIS